MVMQTGERWHCTNPACRCEVLVQANSKVSGTNPKCGCGALMKKKYSPPHLTYLEFLRIDETIPAPEVSQKG